MLKILIVEDNILFARDLKEGLVKHECEVLDIATSVTEAIRLFNTHQPELVFIDIELEGEKNGIELAKYINRTKRVPFIFLTDFYGAGNKHFKAATSTRPANFLPKGTFLPKQLWHFVETAMDYFAAENNLFKSDVAPGFFLQGQLFIRDKNAYKRVLATDISYIEVADAYCKIYAADKVYMPKITLDKLISNLNCSFIVRSHQSHAVNVNFIKEYSPSTGKIVLHTDRILTLGRTYKTGLLERLNLQG